MSERASALRLIFARHGETDANTKLMIDSRPPGGPLTDLGRQQARALADDLAAEPVVAVYASVAIRAQQTAQPIADGHGLAVRVVDGLQEVSVGDLEGRNDVESLRAFNDVFLAWLSGDLSGAMPGGESGHEVVARFTKAVQEITAAHTDGTVVVVSHGAMLRLGTPFQTTNLDPADLGLIRLTNTARIVLEEGSPVGSGWHCVEWAGIRLGAAT